MVKIYKNIFYFKKFIIAREWAENNGWPIDRIIRYQRGWAIQFGKSGNYAGPKDLRSFIGN